MKNISTQINKRIAMYRNLAGFTQEAAANALNMKKNTYARMERYGNPKPDMLRKLAELYNVRVDYFIYGETVLSQAAETLNQHPPLVFKDYTTPIFATEEPYLTLTTNEKNCVKMCRNLPRDKRTEILKIINDFCNENIPEED